MAEPTEGTEALAAPDAVVSSPSSSNGAEPAGPVRLTVPAEARFLRLARLTAAGLAGDLGYGVDAIEDLRIAVDELCAAVIQDADASAELTVTYREEHGALVVEGRCDDTTAPLPELHAVAQELLAMLADEYAVAGDATGRTFRLVKRSQPVR
jgi:serine/threonine-protein kinase RsbW